MSGEGGTVCAARLVGWRGVLGVTASRWRLHALIGGPDQLRACTWVQVQRPLRR